MRRLVFAGFAQLVAAAVGFAQTPNLFPNHPTQNPTHAAPDPFRPSTPAPAAPQSPGLLPPLKATAPTPPAQPGEPALLPPQLAPEVKLPQKENLARIDPNGMSARRTDAGKWAVVTGFVTVREFGSDQAAAEEFVKVLRDLRPTDWGTVGTARVVVEYGLTGTAAQQPTFTPKTTVLIDPASLRIESVRGVWVVRDDDNILLNFGKEKEDAEQAVGVIRKYGFNRIGQVGAAGVGVTFLFAQETSAAGKAKPKPPVAGALADLQKAMQEEKLTRTAIDVPGEKGAAVGERISIDPKGVELKRDHGDWKLVYGQEVLANFGPSEWSGRDALKLVQEQHFTEFCRFNSEVTYFLVNGQAPTKVPFAVQATRFDREAVKVKAASGGKYGLYEGSGRQLFACDSEKEAERLLKVLQEYGFDTSCQIGLGAKSSLRFLAKTGR